MEQPPIRLITFDLDDTLWPLKSVLNHAEQQTYQWLEQHAPKITSQYSIEDVIHCRMALFQQDKSYQHRIGELRVRGYSEIAEQSGYTTHESQSIAKQAFECFLIWRQRVSLFDGTKNVLRLLSKKYLLGAITNGNADISSMPIGKYFGFHLNAEAAGCCKPDVRIFKQAQTLASEIAQHEILDKEILHVGDSLELDYRGAINAGFNAVLLRHPAVTFIVEKTGKDCLDLTTIPKITDIAQLLDDNFIEQL